MSDAVLINSGRSTAVFVGTPDAASAKASADAAAASALSIVDLSAVNWSLVSGATLTAMFNAMKTAGLFDGFQGT